MNLEGLFVEIIEKKYSELNFGKDFTEKFSKIRSFEGNAI